MHRSAHKKRYQNPKYAADCKARSAKWRKDNPLRYEELLKAWKVDNPERAKAIQRAGSINRRSKMRAAGKISANDVRVVRARKDCAACGGANPRMEIDHIKAISRGGTNHLSNLQLLCRPCNRSKWAKDYEAWLRETQATL